MIQNIEMPKTMREKLEDLEVNASFPINKTDRSNAYTAMGSLSDRKFTIRQIKANGELRVWRTK